MFVLDTADGKLTIIPGARQRRPRRGSAREGVQRPAAAGWKKRTKDRKDGERRRPAVRHVLLDLDGPALRRCAPARRESSGGVGKAAARARRARGARQRPRRLQRPVQMLPFSAAHPVAYPLAAGGLQDPRDPRRKASPRHPSALRRGSAIPSHRGGSALENLGSDDGRPPRRPSTTTARAGTPEGSCRSDRAGDHRRPRGFAHRARRVRPTRRARSQGDEVLVSMTDGSELTFPSRLMQSSKSEFPTAEVYSNVPAPSCG